MLRVVLAAVLTIALLGVSFPVIEDAEATRIDRLADSEVDRLTDAITELERENAPVTDRAFGARTVITVTIPSSRVTTTAAARIAIGGVPGSRTPGDTATRDVIAYRVADGHYHVQWVPVDLRIDTGDNPAADDEPLVLTGTARLTFTLVTRNGQPTILVRRGG